MDDDDTYRPFVSAAPARTKTSPAATTIDICTVSPTSPRSSTEIDTSAPPALLSGAENPSFETSTFSPNQPVSMNSSTDVKAEADPCCPAAVASLSNASSKLLALPPGQNIPTPTASKLAPLTDQPRSSTSPFKPDRETSQVLTSSRLETEGCEGCGSHSRASTHTGSFPNNQTYAQNSSYILSNISHIEHLMTSLGGNTCCGMSAATMVHSATPGQGGIAAMTHTGGVPKTFDACQRAAGDLRTAMARSLMTGNAFLDSQHALLRASLRLSEFQHNQAQQIRILATSNTILTQVIGLLAASSPLFKSTNDTCSKPPPDKHCAGAPNNVGSILLNLLKHATTAALAVTQSHRESWMPTVPSVSRCITAPQAPVATFASSNPAIEDSAFSKSGAIICDGAVIDVKQLKVFLHCVGELPADPAYNCSTASATGLFHAFDKLKLTATPAAVPSETSSAGNRCGVNLSGRTAADNIGIKYHSVLETPTSQTLGQSCTNCQAQIGGQPVLEGNLALAELENPQAHKMARQLGGWLQREDFSSEPHTCTVCDDQQQHQGGARAATVAVAAAAVTEGGIQISSEPVSTGWRIQVGEVEGKSSDSQLLSRDGSNSSSSSSDNQNSCCVSSAKKEGYQSGQPCNGGDDDGSNNILNALLEILCHHKGSSQGATQTDAVAAADSKKMHCCSHDGWSSQQFMDNGSIFDKSSNGMGTIGTTGTTTESSSLCDSSRLTELWAGSSGSCSDQPESFAVQKCESGYAGSTGRKRSNHTMEGMIESRREVSTSPSCAPPLSLSFLPSPSSPHQPQQQPPVAKRLKPEAISRNGVHPPPPSSAATDEIGRECIPASPVITASPASSSSSSRGTGQHSMQAGAAAAAADTVFMKSSSPAGQIIRKNSSSSSNPAALDSSHSILPVMCSPHPVTTSQDTYSYRQQQPQVRYGLNGLPSNQNSLRSRTSNSTPSKLKDHDLLSSLLISPPAVPAHQILKPNIQSQSLRNYRTKLANGGQQRTAQYPSTSTTCVSSATSVPSIPPGGGSTILLPPPCGSFDAFAKRIFREELVRWPGLLMLDDYLFFDFKPSIKLSEESGSSSVVPSTTSSLRGAKSNERTTVLCDDTGSSQSYWQAQIFRTVHKVTKTNENSISANDYESHENVKGPRHQQQQQQQHEEKIGWLEPLKIKAWSTSIQIIGKDIDTRNLEILTRKQYLDSNSIVAFRDALKQCFVWAQDVIQKLELPTIALAAADEGVLVSNDILMKSAVSVLGETAAPTTNHLLLPHSSTSGRSTRSWSSLSSSSIAAPTEPLAPTAPNTCKPAGVGGGGYYVKEDDADERKFADLTFNWDGDFSRLEVFSLPSDYGRSDRFDKRGGLRYIQLTQPANKSDHHSTQMTAFGEELKREAAHKLSLTTKQNFECFWNCRFGNGMWKAEIVVDSVSQRKNSFQRSVKQVHYQRAVVEVFRWLMRRVQEQQVPYFRIRGRKDEVVVGVHGLFSPRHAALLSMQPPTTTSVGGASSSSQDLKSSGRRTNERHASDFRDPSAATNVEDLVKTENTATTDNLRMSQSLSASLKEESLHEDDGDYPSWGPATDEAAARPTATAATRHHHHHHHHHHHTSKRKFRDVDGEQQQQQCRQHRQPTGGDSEETENGLSAKNVFRIRIPNAVSPNGTSKVGRRTTDLIGEAVIQEHRPPLRAEQRIIS